MSFQDIYGHEKQIRILQSAILSNRVPHAYLFYGMQGIGKRTVAEMFAKVLHCKGKNGRADSCDHCPSCIKTDHKNHPDVITITADGQFIKIKEIRYIQEQMKFAPFEGGKRIFIIVDAEKMNNVSANALLKTIEEPSRSNLLILITSSPHQLPATILSRCQQLRFNPLLKDTIDSFLQNRMSLDAERAHTIASSSGGSIRKAMDLNEDAYMEILDDIMSILSPDILKDPLKLLSATHSFGQEKREIDGRLNVLLSACRDALIYKETGDEKALMNQRGAEQIKSLAREWSGEKMLYNIRTVDWAMRAIDQNANKQLTLETMVFKLTRRYGSSI